MVQESERLRHARSPGPRSGWFPLGIFAVVVAALVGGWMVLDSALPSTAPVAAGQSMIVASGQGHEAKLTFDQDWDLHVGSSTQGQRYRFAKGTADLEMNVLTPPARTSELELWEGLRKVVRVGDASANLTDPRSVTSEAGADGLAGQLHSNRHTGIAALFPSPNGEFAVGATATGDQADLAEVERLLRSIRFDRAPEGGS